MAMQHLSACGKKVQGLETILLVEDDETLRKILAGTLQSNGYAVLEAGEALTAIKICVWHTGPIDAIVTDVGLPHMSGPALCESVLSLRPDMKALFISGAVGEALLFHDMVKPGINLLKKPFTPDALLHALRATMDGLPIVDYGMTSRRPTRPPLPQAHTRALDQVGH